MATKSEELANKARVKLALAKKYENLCRISCHCISKLALENFERNFALAKPGNLNPLRCALVGARIRGLYFFGCVLQNDLDGSILQAFCLVFQIALPQGHSSLY